MVSMPVTVGGVVAVVMVLVAAEEPGADGLSLNRSEPTKRAAKIPRKIVAGQQELSGWWKR